MVKGVVAAVYSISRGPPRKRSDQLPQESARQKRSDYEGLQKPMTKNSRFSATTLHDWQSHTDENYAKQSHDTISASTTKGHCLKCAHGDAQNASEEEHHPLIFLKYWMQHAFEL